MKDIGLIVSQSIKEQKYLEIKYHNRSDRDTTFWIAVQDIDFEKKTLIVDMFNDYHSNDVKQNMTISYEKILGAKILDGTTYNLRIDLNNKIINNLESVQWLHYNLTNNNVLNYYKEAFKNDIVPFVKHFNLIKGIDTNSIYTQGTYYLTIDQFKTIISTVIDTNKIKFNSRNTIIKMGINILSISTKNGLFPLLYHEVKLDIENKTLKLDSEISFNYGINFSSKVSGYFHQFVNLNKEDFENLAKYN